MLEWTIFILIFASIALLGSLLIPFIVRQFHNIQAKKVEKAEKKLDDMFVRVDPRKLFFYYTLSPLILGVAGLIFFHQVIFAVLGGLVGLSLPTLFIKRLEAVRKQKFSKQLTDALMVLSSSLKSGLSLLQAFEVLVEDMPSPINEEFSLLLRENKMGIPLSDSLVRLNKRMQIDELELMINSIVLSQETGGDLTRVFSRLSTTIRDNQKLKDNVATLTLQGRLQGIIMSFLPIVFVLYVNTFSKGHFNIMINTDLGRMLLVVAIVLQVVGMVLIYHFSQLKL